MKNHFVICKLVYIDKIPLKTVKRSKLVGRTDLYIGEKRKMFT